MEIMTTVRACSYLAGVLASQQRDPLCSRCKAFVNSVAAAREMAASCEGRMREAAALPADSARLFREALALLSGLDVPADAVGQKKAGNCMLSPGQCFVKSSLAFFRGLETPPAA